MSVLAHPVSRSDPAHHTQDLDTATSYFLCKDAGEDSDTLSAHDGPTATDLKPDDAVARTPSSTIATTICSFLDLVHLVCLARDRFALLLS